MMMDLGAAPTMLWEQAWGCWQVRTNRIGVDVINFYCLHICPLLNVVIVADGIFRHTSIETSLALHKKQTLQCRTAGHGAIWKFSLDIDVIILLYYLLHLLKNIICHWVKQWADTADVWVFRPAMPTVLGVWRSYNRYDSSHAFLIPYNSTISTA